MENYGGSVCLSESWCNHAKSVHTLVVERKAGCPRNEMAVAKTMYADGFVNHKRNMYENRPWHETLTHTDGALPFAALFTGSLVTNWQS